MKMLNSRDEHSRLTLVGYTRKRHPITEVTINGLRLTRSRTPLLVAANRYVQLLDKNLDSGLGDIGSL